MRVTAGPQWRMVGDNHRYLVIGRPDIDRTPTANVYSKDEIWRGSNDNVRQMANNRSTAQAVDDLSGQIGRD